MNKLVAIILETRDKEYTSRLSEQYHSFFKEARFEAEITCVYSESELKDKLKTKIVDIVISDLSLNSEDFAGLIVVQSIKKEYPDIFCIGTSGKDIGYRETAVKLPTFDMFIDKSGLLGNMKFYIRAMVEEFLAKFKRNTDVEIDMRSKIPDKLNNKELFSLLSQVTFVSHKQDPYLDYKKILLTPLSGGKSGSYVFKMTATSSQGTISSVPAVLKISKREYAEEELENYNRFVKWVLPYTWRVDLLGVGFTKSFGAVCHSFILSGFKDFDSLTYYLSHEEINIVNDVIDKIFDPKIRSWYADEIIQYEENINERYLNRYFKNEESKIMSSRNFSIFCQEIFTGCIVTKTYLKVFDHQFPLPMDCLFGRAYGKYQSCICHGDMNSNNIIVAQNGEIIFIDFQHTGRGHVFEDFISMETSVRIYFGTDLSETKKVCWEDVFQWEESLTAASSEIDIPQMYKIIAHIRLHAKKNFPEENFQNYYYGLAAVNYKLLRLPDLLNEQKGYLLTGILASLDKLERR